MLLLLIIPGVGVIATVTAIIIIIIKKRKSSPSSTVNETSVYDNNINRKEIDNVSIEIEKGNNDEELQDINVDGVETTETKVDHSKNEESQSTIIKDDHSQNISEEKPQQINKEKYPIINFKTVGEHQYELLKSAVKKYYIE